MYPFLNGAYARQPGSMNDLAFWANGRVLLYNDGVGWCLGNATATYALAVSMGAYPPSGAMWEAAAGGDFVPDGPVRLECAGACRVAASATVVAPRAAICVRL